MAEAEAFDALDMAEQGIGGEGILHMLEMRFLGRCYCPMVSVLGHAVYLPRACSNSSDG